MSISCRTSLVLGRLPPMRFSRSCDSWLSYDTIRCVLAVLINRLRAQRLVYAKGQMIRWGFCYRQFNEGVARVSVPLRGFYTRFMRHNVRRRQTQTAYEKDVQITTIDVMRALRRCCFPQVLRVKAFTAPSWASNSATAATLLTTPLQRYRLSGRRLIAHNSCATHWLALNSSMLA